MSNQAIIHAEISVIPIGSSTGITTTTTTSMSKEIAAAFDAIRKIEGIEFCSLTPMGTLIESHNIANILEAIKVAHQAIKYLGAKRIISIIHIDERLDEPKSMEDKLESVKEKLSKQ
jgi:uncharacterized protein (TIGR00106 family)